MSILTFIKRVWPSDANKAGTKAHSEDVDDNPCLSDHERDARILELLDHPNPTGETIEKLARLMGQTDEKKI